MKIKGFSTSYAALGYHAFEIEKDSIKASLLWTEGWEKYKDIDCAFNLGYLWSVGLYMKEPADLVSPFQDILSFINFSILIQNERTQKSEKILGFMVLCSSTWTNRRTAKGGLLLIKRLRRYHSRPEIGK